jgi:hypothetical protein
VLLGSFSASKEPILFQNRRTRGIAWIDNHTVRVAWTGPDPTNALEVRAVTVTGQ